MGVRCASCGYDNDPTRVYCHNCATRIDRGGAAPPAPTGFTHPTDAAKMKRKRAPGAWLKWIGSLGKMCMVLLKLCIVSALVAAIAFALLSPPDVPPPVPGDADLARRLGDLVGQASSSSSSIAFAVPASDLQKWFAAVVQVLPASGALPLNPKRVYVVPMQGRVRLGLECGLPADYSLYMEGEYEPVLAGNAYRLEPRRYSIGRLPLPVALGYPVQSQFDGLLDALSTTLAQLAKASSIEVAPDKVSFRWAGSGNP